MSETASLGEVEHDPNDWAWMRQVYGLYPGEAAVQEVGKIHLVPGRVLMWPSTLQARVTPFSLKDKKKPGNVKILAIYLVDPNIRIVSTANIPPQRMDWTQEMQDLGLSRYDELKTLPSYLLDRAMNRKDGFPLNLDDAKKYSKKLWTEFQQFREYQDVAFTSNTIEA